MHVLDGYTDRAMRNASHSSEPAKWMGVRVARQPFGHPFALLHSPKADHRARCENLGNVRWRTNSTTPAANPHRRNGDGYPSEYRNRSPRQPQAIHAPGL